MEPKLSTLASAYSLKRVVKVANCADLVVPGVGATTPVIPIAH